MDFQQLLLVADQNSKNAAKQSQKVKRLDTSFTAPAKKEEKHVGPKSEAVMKLLKEKEGDKQKLKDAQERDKRRKQKEKEEQEQEEKRKNTFRIPKAKKAEASEDPPSDAESFSSISSDEASAKDSKSSGHRSQSSHRVSSEKGDRHSSSGKSSSKHSSSHGGKDKSSSSDKHKHSSSDKDKPSSSEKHKHTSSDKDKPSSSEKQNHSSSNKDKTSSSEKQNHSSSNKDKTSSSEKHKHLSSDKDKSSSEKQKHSSSDKDKHLSSDKDKHSSSSKHKSSSSEKHKHSSSSDKKSSSGTHHHSSSEKHKHSSEKRSSSDKKHKSSSSSHSHSKSHSSSSGKKKQSRDNDSSGYITSPDLSSEEDGPTSSKTQAEEEEEAIEYPVEFIELSRHHLKPTIERVGCTSEARDKVLARLQAIKDKLNGDDDEAYHRTRAAKGEVKKRRAKREKLEGDFSGPCMEKIEYEETDKPSLKRPEPKPEEIRVSHEKKRRRLPRFEGSQTERTERREKKEHKKPNDVRRAKHESKHKDPARGNRFDSARGDKKPKFKPRFNHRPPPVNFADLMKMAESKHAQPVMVEAAAPKKKEKERRPMTQEEIDRQRQREDRVKSKDYKDWYKYGDKGKKDNSDGGNGGGAKDARRDNNNAGPPGPSGHPKPSTSTSSSGQHRGSNDRPNDCDRDGERPDKHNGGRPDKPKASGGGSNDRSGRPSSGFKPQPHPTRPGMIANKPRAMMQQMSAAGGGGGERDQQRKRAPSPLPQSRDSSPSPPPRAKAADIYGDRSKGGNAWDSLFSRPEYKQREREPQAKKGRMVIESEEESDYDDEMDDFIDDEGDTNMDSVSGEIRSLFGYDRRKFRDEDDDDRSMEVGFSQIMKEEAKSARLGRQEDLEDMRLEQEELMRKKKMRR